MSTVEIPEPLATVLQGAAAWMVLGMPGSTTCSKGGSTENYRELLKEHRRLVLPFLRQEVQRKAGQLSVREVSRDAVSMSSPMFRYFATCEQGSPGTEVTQLSEPGLASLYSIGVEPRFSRVGVVVLHMHM